MDENGVRLDVSEGAREMVDLSAEAVNSLGAHLSQIGDIIGKSKLPPGKGERGTALKVKDKFALYNAYCDEVLRRKAELEKKMLEDYNRLCEWRKQSGTEGASLVETMEKLYDESRALKGEMQFERALLAEEKSKVRDVIVRLDRKGRQSGRFAKEFVRRKWAAARAYQLSRMWTSWVEYSFSEIRFKLKAAEEREKLKLEHHRKMRKARAQARIDVIQRSRDKPLLQKCWLALQEEGLEARALRHLEMLRNQYNDHVLVLEAQLAQAVGDEESAKELVAEQVRRLEEQKELARQAENEKKMALRKMRAAEEEAERQKFEKERALAAEAAALERAQQADEDADAARKQADEAVRRAAVSDAARNRAEQGQRDAEEQVRKKAKKIASMQRMIAELGAESDSDAPPDERPPAFFVNEDGSRKPRERTRKERMGMAYREAESARLELRLGMAAMIDQAVNKDVELQRLRTELTDHQHEVQEVRTHNKQLSMDADSAMAMAAAKSAEADKANAAAAAAAAELNGKPRTPMRTSSTLSTTASSLGPKTAWGSPTPTSPAFPGTSPLFKSSSQPAIVPALRGHGPSLVKIVAPLRRVKRAGPSENWHAGWH